MLKELEEDRIETPSTRKHLKKDKYAPNPIPHTPRMLKELMEDRLDSVQTLSGHKRKRVYTYEIRKETKTATHQVTTTTTKKGVG